MHIRLILFLGALASLALIHNAAITFYLYWNYLWIDIPVHMFGGMCVALGISILPFFHISLPKKCATLLGYLSIILLVGIVWELFEFGFGVSVFDEHFILDTTIDFCMNTIGGILGYGLVQKLDQLERM